MLSAWLRAFLFTQLVEVPIYVRGLRCSALAAFGASTLTHPVVWFLFFSPRWQAGYLTRFTSAELFAWLVEAAYFKFLVRRDRALLWSLLANAASVALGALSRSLFGAP
jgi:hypothetical protein